jgi:hypothetical protein
MTFQPHCLFPSFVAANFPELKRKEIEISVKIFFFAGKTSKQKNEKLLILFFLIIV